MPPKPARAMPHAGEGARRPPPVPLAAISCEHIIMF